MKTQKEMFWESHDKIALLNIAVMEMMHDPFNPMTRDDLIKLIEKRPEVYGRFQPLVDNQTNWNTFKNLEYSVKNIR